MAIMISMSGLDWSWAEKKTAPEKVEPVEVLCIAPDGAEAWVDGAKIKQSKKRGRPRKSKVLH